MEQKCLHRIQSSLSLCVLETCFLILCPCMCVCVIYVCVSVNVISSPALRRSTGSPSQQEVCGREPVSSSAWPQCCSASLDWQLWTGTHVRMGSAGGRDCWPSRGRWRRSRRAAVCANAASCASGTPQPHTHPGKLPAHPTHTALPPWKGRSLGSYVTPPAPDRPCPARGTHSWDPWIQAHTGTLGLRSVCSRYRRSGRRARGRHRRVRCSSSRWTRACTSMCSRLHHPYTCPSSDTENAHNRPHWRHSAAQQILDDTDTAPLSPRLHTHHLHREHFTRQLLQQI